MFKRPSRSEGSSAGTLSTYSSPLVSQLQHQLQTTQIELQTTQSHLYLTEEELRTIRERLDVTREQLDATRKQIDDQRIGVSSIIHITNHQATTNPCHFPKPLSP